MSVVLQINYTGPGWSPERARHAAQRIADIPVLHWELLIQCETEGTWGGIYLFETEASARTLEDQVRVLLAGIGAVSIVTQVLYVDEIETGVQRAPLSRRLVRLGALWTAGACLIEAVLAGHPRRQRFLSRVSDFLGSAHLSK
jgi:Putative mono-oxygenase ydhR